MTERLETEPTPPPVLRCAVRPGAYHDSVVLMGLQAQLAALPGVVEAAVVMAVPANRELLAGRGLLPPAAAAAGPADLLVVVRAETGEQAGEALGRVDALLAARSRAGAAAGDGFRPRTLAAAVKLLPAARWVLVSVPGRYAAAVARQALDLGRNVFLFSDNVALADEAALKQMAGARGLLVLGPDCGTALLAGIGLGFANRVRRGAIGLLGASGTGLQAVTSEIHRLGAGVSHAIGTGGRDLAVEIGGATTLQGLDLLRRDPDTEVIVLLAKALASPVAARLLAAARQAGKPVVVCFLGAPPPARQLGNLHFAADTSDAAATAVMLLGAGSPRSAPQPSPALAPPPSSAAAAPLDPPEPPFAPGQRYLRGLFSGGSLAAEALLGLQAELGPILTNFSAAPPASAPRPLPVPRQAPSHTLIDLGSDELTIGRPHPMIDHGLLLQRLVEASADPEVALILLDVVLGDGAHPDPAGDLAPAVARAREQAAAAGRTLEVLAIVIGTDGDPQGLAEQLESLAAAGARVHRTVGAAVDHACRRLAPLAADGAPRPATTKPPVGLETIRDPLARINAGPGRLETLREPPATISVGPVELETLREPLAAINVGPVALETLRGPLAAINVGLESFHTSLLTQGVAAVHVDWRPPAGGDERLAALLAKMNRSG